MNIISRRIVTPGVSPLAGRVHPYSPYRAGGECECHGCFGPACHSVRQRCRSLPRRGSRVRADTVRRCPRSAGGSATGASGARSIEAGVRSDSRLLRRQACRARGEARRPPTPGSSGSGPGATATAQPAGGCAVRSGGFWGLKGEQVLQRRRCREIPHGHSGDRHFLGAAGKTALNPRLRSELPERRRAQAIGILCAPLILLAAHRGPGDRRRILTFTGLPGVAREGRQMKQQSGREHLHRTRAVGDGAMCEESPRPATKD